VTPDEVGNPQTLSVSARLNGNPMQDGHTSQMLFGVARLLAYASTFMTLNPGDVLATGTPSGVGFARQPPIFLKPGDVTEATVERIGTLRNPVQPAPR
jgi:2-keto-4-pentenoate hydratase/2-oxohepta-3-ene-1,7-dioic acid hydratase in catechol pathway